jgi:formylglycine-generating enzyme required for sulfatase activity
LAHEIAAELGKRSGDDELREVYRRFNRHFGLTTYKKLPRRRFEEGLAFFTEWRDEIAVTKPPDRRIHAKTGIELIRIPAGAFLYGEDKREIELPEYWIGRYPVTNAEYKRFLRANPKYQVPFYEADWAQPFNWDKKRRTYSAGKADYPVVWLSWDDVTAFCSWAGLTLPTEEQWEKAARGTDGRIWPWGDDPPTSEHCNFNRNVGHTTPVGRYSPKGDSPYGCADMAGNVWEWASSWDVEGPTRALRGGSWRQDSQRTRAVYRDNDFPGFEDSGVGFRVVELLSDPGF